MLIEPVLLQDVRLQDIVSVTEAHWALCSRRAQHSVAELQQKGPVDYRALTACLNSSACMSHAGAADLRLADVERMVSELQQQPVS